MKIKPLDDKDLRKKHAYWGFYLIQKTSYDVLAIKCYHKNKQYLIEYDMRLSWWDSELFEVVEDSIPDEWIEIRYKYFYKLKNDNYYFDIPINYYLGPKFLLENKNFMFDIVENPREAYLFYKRGDTNDGSVSP